ncbi:MULTISPECIES: circularly permuted type 2 ATP-grasp protein [unclassified Haematobacter]|uniref:circularly permuted type 2 ATP-grasp protein n=1 Tax=unclassified Haematobacter TaxID=2640585 RepID=UPI0025BF4742|nr:MULTISPECIES: circularly permuted type 2 ATP-grasp protein [unclassified Haematobacter]
MGSRSAPVAKDALARLLAVYRPKAGVPDELIDAGGRVRPVWRPFMERLSLMTEEEIRARGARADQYLRDAGVFHRQYGTADAADRDWPLSPVPLLLPESEWRALSAGLIQRANLLEALVADLYGPNRLVREGHLPAELVAANPEWLRPLVGVTPKSGDFLHFLAFDLGRGPNGDWWVLSDRAQAPSGAGFALENRIATGRAFPDAIAEQNVHRLAGFFRAFRDRLMDLRGGEEERIGILTPGPMSETYFEHAFIARYLGFSLLEGDDLTVRDGALLIRTVAGLRPISVLWRRMDAAWTDPMELNEASRLGTPGLIGAIRAGNLAMVNALGSGVVEMRALLAFLPRIAEAMTGAPLLLPNIATWWCGQAAERDHVRRHADEMTISPALSNRLFFDLEAEAAVAGRFRGTPPAPSLDDWIMAGSGDLVGQEAVHLSTMPALVEGRLVPRPYSLRVYLARTAEGWTVMPGGFARIGTSEDPTAVALRQGASVADVWVVADAPVEADTMIQRPSVAEFRRQAPLLPARAADNLYWLGRYVERAETTVRLLRAWHARVAETGEEDAPLQALIGDCLEDRGAKPGAGVPAGLRDMLRGALTAASHVRDRFSVDGWMALTDLDGTAGRLAGVLKPGDDGARGMSVLLRKITGFSGLVHENMYHTMGWRFLSTGRALERALGTARLLAVLADETAPEGALDVAVEVGDSVMTHRSRFAAEANRATVIDLLALDRLNPRAVLYQLDLIQERMGVLWRGQGNAPMGEVERAVLRLRTRVATATPEELTGPALDVVAEGLGEISVLIGRKWLI